MGIGMRAAVRSQINLMMNAAEHVKQFKGVRDIVYPILWFQVSFTLVVPRLSGLEAAFPPTEQISTAIWRATFRYFWSFRKH
jgi:hypothetical protein